MFKLDSRSSKPIYEQIVDGVKENILKGILKPDEKLPSVRNLSKTLMINPNTVSKAYLELERQRVVKTVKGRGTYVSEEYIPKLQEEEMKNTKEIVKKLIIEAHYNGIDKNKFLNIVNEVYDELGGKESD